MDQRSSFYTEEEGKSMKVRTLYVLVLFVLAFSTTGCGKKEAGQPAAEQPAATKTVDPATAGTVAGSVKFEGTPPKPVRIRMDADAACARLHKGPVFADEVAVSPGGALANVVVYVKSGLDGYSFPKPTETVVLDQKGCMYRPRVIALQTGQTLEVLNSDDTTHNIHPVPNINREWNRSQPPRGEKIVESFAREEVAIAVKCNIHPWMKSYIAVVKHPYFKVTGSDGTFELKGLPPGVYTLEAWHETLGISTQQVTLGANETKSVSFVFQGG